MSNVQPHQVISRKSQTGQTIQGTARANKLLARYGGEEFIMLRMIGRETAATAAERIRSHIETECTPYRNPSLQRQITVSIGVGALTASIGTLETLIEVADKELYRAKKVGKNSMSSTVN